MSTDDTAVLIVDLHRGHLDPEIATLPVPQETAEQVRSHAETLVTRARDSGYPTIYVTTGYRDAKEILSNLKVATDEKKESGDSHESISVHILIGSAGLDIVSELCEDEDGDVYLQLKNRYSPFIDTDPLFASRRTA